MSIRRRSRLTVILLVAGCSACAARGPAPEDVHPGWTQTGVASWYGPGFHGRPTASGERYDMEAMTAAHPWLPFGTLLRVENRDNGRRAEVRVNDRGPFARGRILDVSRAAARALGMLGPGTARVRVRVLEVPAACRELQVGAYSEEANVDAAMARVRSAGLTGRREPGPEGLTRVLAGPFADEDAARRARARVGGRIRPCAAR